MAESIISRSEARSLGLKQYFIGKPCAHGHVAPRAVRDNRCYECHADYMRKWSKNNREKLHMWGKRYRTENREKVRESKRRYDINNREKMRAWKKRYSDKNREKWRIYCLQRRARKAGTDDWELAIISQQAAKWLAAKRLKCYLCGDVIKNGDLHIDHIVPIAKGGKHVLENLAPACSYCNRSKGTRDVNEILVQGLLL